MKSTTFKVAVVVVAALIIAGCSGSGRTRVTYGVGMGYGGYYGGGPWRGYHGYPPVYVGDGGGYPDIPDIPDGPSASQMPEFGMPDAGMMDDMGGFDF
jgi:hypothetical protein